MIFNPMISIVEEKQVGRRKSILLANTYTLQNCFLKGLKTSYNNVMITYNNI
jgi:hypothetical protein